MIHRTVAWPLRDGLTQEWGSRGEISSDIARARSRSDLVPHRHVERSLQHVDQLRIGLEGVRLVAAASARLDPDSITCSECSQRGGQDDVLDPVAAEVHGFTLAACGAGSSAARSNSDPIRTPRISQIRSSVATEAFVSSRSSRLMNPFDRSAAEASSAIGHPTGLACGPEASPDLRRVDRVSRILRGGDSGVVRRHRVRFHRRASPFGRSTSSTHVPSGSRAYSTFAPCQDPSSVRQDRPGDDADPGLPQPLVERIEVADPQTDVGRAGVPQGLRDRRPARMVESDQLEDPALRQVQVGPVDPRAGHPHQLRELLVVRCSPIGHGKPEQARVERDRRLEIARRRPTSVEPGHPRARPRRLVVLAHRAHCAR